MKYSLYRVLGLATPAIGLRAPMMAVRHESPYDCMHGTLLCACEANEVVLDAVPDSLPDTEAGGIAADIISVLDSSLAPDAGMDTHAGQHNDTVGRIPVDDSSSFEPSDTSQIDADLGDTYDGPPIVGLAEAKALYGTYCSLCHGPNGEGYLADGANQLNNQSWLATVSDEHIQAAIAIGRPSTTMSSWSKTYAGPLTGVETQALVKLIRGWQTEPYIELQTSQSLVQHREELAFGSSTARAVTEPMAVVAPSPPSVTQSYFLPRLMPFFAMQLRRADRVHPCLATTTYLPPRRLMTSSY